MRTRIYSGLFALGLLAAGCDLSVDNPNNLLEQELDNPTVAASLANGAEATVTRALGAMLGPMPRLPMS